MERREFLEDCIDLLGLAMILGGISGSSRMIFNSKPESISKDDEMPVKITKEDSTPTMSQTATKEIQPTATKISRETQKPPEKPKVDRKSFNLGELDLSQPYTMAIPMKVADKWGTAIYKMDPIANKAAEISPEVYEKINDWVNYPYAAAVILTEPADDGWENYQVDIHSSYGQQGQPLPGEGMRVGGTEILERPIKIIQIKEDGRIIESDFKISQRKEISLEDYSKASAKGTNGEYGFFRTDKLGVDRKPNQILFSLCFGRTKFSPEHNKYIFIDRLIVGAEMVSQGVIDK